MAPNEPLVCQVVCDAGPVIHLDELGCGDLFRDFKEVILTEAVWNEIIFNRPAGWNKQVLPFIRKPNYIPEGQDLTTLCRVFSLHRGEVSALGIMANNPGALFLTDDCAARLVADKMGYNVHGTVGILLRAIRRELLKPSEVLNLLSELPQRSSLYIRTSLLNEVIENLKKEFQL
ncbi:MAG: DNA-binding protein [Candidatus Auribacterota bacterium]|nr:DNA-binding protein [Candidatus Auribacterota bacterium]